MTPLTKQLLEERLAGLRIAREQLIGQLNQAAGMMLMLEQLLQEETCMTEEPLFSACTEGPPDSVSAPRVPQGPRRVGLAGEGRETVPPGLK